MEDLQNEARGDDDKNSDILYDFNGIDYDTWGLKEDIDNKENLLMAANIYKDTNDRMRSLAMAHGLENHDRGYSYFLNEEQVETAERIIEHFRDLESSSPSAPLQRLLDKLREEEEESNDR